MKNKIIIGAVSIAMCTPAMADINKNASTATCDSSTIGATSGNAYMDTAWTANTINLDFYSDGEKISTGSCTYDGAIELPNDPEDKTGYTFGGWKVKVVASQQCSLAGLNIAISSSWNTEYVQYRSALGDNGDSWGDQTGLENGEWQVKFYHGIVKGRALCSSTGEGLDWGDTGSPNEAGGGQYCWCRATKYTPYVYGVDEQVYLIGYYTSLSTCAQAICDISQISCSKGKGGSRSPAESFVINASPANPRLIPGATGENMTYLTDNGCITIGSVMGDTCSVASTSWVFSNEFNDLGNCADKCASYCADNVQAEPDFRQPLYGAEE